MHRLNYCFREGCKLCECISAAVKFSPFRAQQIFTEMKKLCRRMDGVLLVCVEGVQQSVWEACDVWTSPCNKNRTSMQQGIYVH